MRHALVTALLAGALQPMASAQIRDAPALAEDPAIEARVMSLSTELRCLVCQNQTIADSNAPLAVDLRNQVRDQVRAGRSDAQIVDYLVARYGDFVLYRPPLKLTTVLLWAGPFLLLVGGLAGLIVTLRRRAAQAVPMESTEGDAEARARAKALLDEPGRSDGRA